LAFQRGGVYNKRRRETNKRFQRGGIFQKNAYREQYYANKGAIL
jgi:hypothetical protein